MATDLGSVLLVANPAAQNGNGAAAARSACALLRQKLSPLSVEVATTTAPKHAIEIASGAASYDTVLALGGDGIISETVNGLMAIPQDKRPRFGIIPVGSGNDYAQTIGMPRGVDKAVSALLDSREVAVDVGLCNDQYFVETVSFGLDAAIALETVERRQRTGRTGLPLYLGASMNQLINHLDAIPYTLAVDGGAPKEGVMYLLAVQNGPCYGGGFKITPKASITDGLLDLAIAHPPLTRAKGVFILLLAKEGHHTSFKELEFLRAHRVRLTFNEEPPAQADGEKLHGTVFDLGLAPKALRLLVPHRSNRTAVDPHSPAAYVRIDEGSARGQSR